MLIFSKEDNHTIRENYTLGGSYYQAKKALLTKLFFLQVLDSHIARKVDQGSHPCRGAFETVVVFKQQFSKNASVEVELKRPVGFMKW